MNDREYFLNAKQMAERGPIMVPQEPDESELKKRIMQKAQYTRFYFDCLKLLGFDDNQALYLTANSEM